MDGIIGSLTSMNPWWKGEHFQKEGITERTVQKPLLKSLGIRHIKDVIGVRRSGKTTLLKLIIESLIEQGISPQKIFFLSFDDINLSTASFQDIEKAIAQIEIDPEYLFLDEVQEKKDWERWVKQLYDLQRFKQIFVSGSNTSLLSKDVGRLLTGRHITTIVFPFSFREFLAAHGWKNFERNYLFAEKNKVLHYLSIYVKYGGFPETFGKDETSIHSVLSNTYNDIIARDIATRYSVERAKIDLLVKYLFTNITKEYSYNNLAASIGINIETTERYLECLKDSFLMLSLNVFSYKLKVQYKQNKKIYAIDTGLRNSVSFRFSEDIGKLYENAVYIELMRRAKDVYYWKGDGEVDFVIKEGLKIRELIQVCYDISNEKVKSREIKSLKDAASKFKTERSIIITDDYHSKEENGELIVEFIPLWLWLLEENT